MWIEPKRQELVMDDERESPQIMPKLIVPDGEAAISFYRDVFGATESLRLLGPGDVVVHAELRLGRGTLALGSPARDDGNASPEMLGGSPVHLHLYVPDVDEVFQRAVMAGARPLIPVDDQFYGDRAGRLADPFGHVWVVATRLEELTEREIQARFEDLLAGRDSDT